MNELAHDFPPGDPRKPSSPSDGGVRILTTTKNECSIQPANPHRSVHLVHRGRLDVPRRPMYLSVGDEGIASNRSTDYCPGNWGLLGCLRAGQSCNAWSLQDSQSSRSQLGLNKGGVPCHAGLVTGARRSGRETKLFSSSRSFLLRLFMSHPDPGQVCRVQLCSGNRDAWLLTASIPHTPSQAGPPPKGQS